MIFSVGMFILLILLAGVVRAVIHQPVKARTYGTSLVQGRR